MFFRVSHLDFLRHIGFVLFGLMLVLPYKFQMIKALLLFFFLVYTVILIVKKKLIVTSTKEIIQWILLYVISNIFFIFYGIVLDNPAPFVYINIYFVWPILFTFILILVGKNSFYGIIKCMRYSLLVILLCGIFAFVKFNLEFMQEGISLGFIATIRPGYPFIAISGGAVTNMIFLYFFFLSLCILQPKSATMIDWCNLILGIFFAFFTSRRAILLDFVLSFIFIGIFVCFLKRKERAESFRSFFKISGWLMVFIIFIIFCIYSFEVFELNDFVDFTSSAAGSDNSDPRVTQAWALLDGWMNRPLFGNGTGINASVVRSDLPGTYELTYLAMLFERGLIGTSVFWLQYLMLNYWGIKCLKKKIIPSRYIISLLVALNLFMIANASNPYLGSFDHIVFLLLIFTVINISNKKLHEDWCFNKSL